MSRLGKIPITLPDKVEVSISNDMIQAKGPKGSLNIPAYPGVILKKEGTLLFVVADEKRKLQGRMHGLYRSLIQNMVIGVSKGFEVRLTLIGVGFRAQVQGQMLDLQLGFSHPTKIAIPKGVNIAIDKSTLIVISGMDKQLVGQFAAQVRAVKPPEPYKGKGIRYEDEVVRKKAGKAAKGKTAAAA